MTLNLIRSGRIISCRGSSAFHQSHNCRVTYCDSGSRIRSLSENPPLRLPTSKRSRDRLLAIARAMLTARRGVATDGAPVGSENESSRQGAASSEMFLFPMPGNRRPGIVKHKPPRFPSVCGMRGGSSYLQGWIPDLHQQKNTLISVNYYKYDTIWLAEYGIACILWLLY